MPLRSRRSDPRAPAAPARPGGRRASRSPGGDPPRPRAFPPFAQPPPRRPATLCLTPGECEDGNEIRLLRDGTEAFPRMLDAIRAAEREILLETYLFSSDFVGRQFARLLADRARAGVEVRVMYDAAGSRATPRPFFGWMRSQGIRVLAFHPLLRHLRGLRFRGCNHRKLLVVDRQAAFVGGLNVGRHYAGEAEGGLGWRDTAVEVRGPVAASIARASLDLWGREDGRGRAGAADPPGPGADGPPPHRGDGTGRAGGSPARALYSLDFWKRWEIARHYAHAMGHARRRIWLANPYLLPPIRFRRELRRAARRGVDVRLLVPRRSDCPPALYAAQHLYARYLEWGIRLFEWPGAMMHSKMAVIDGTWSTVGSYNLDALSLFHNYELTVVVMGREFGRRLEGMFEEDFARCREVRPAEWERRGVLRRMAERACFSFRFLL